MSLINDKLSSLQPGSTVKLTQSTGQIIQGVIIENDKTESLSISVTLLATVRYDQISIVEETAIQQNSVVPVQPVSVSVPVIGKETKLEPVLPKAAADSKVSKQEVMTVSFSENEIAEFFNAIEKDAKNILNPQYGKFRSFVQSHDKAKLDESIKLLKSNISGQRWEFNPEINKYYAGLLIYKGDYQNAAEAFFNAGDIRTAYCAAYQGAKEKSDKELYKLAAVFSAIYLNDLNWDNLRETIKVLEESSDKNCDLSGIQFVLNNPLMNKQVREYLKEAVISVCKNNGIKVSESADLYSIMHVVQNKFRKSGIDEMIGNHLNRKVLAEMSDNFYDTVNESAPADKDNSESFREGKIVKYKSTEKKGTIVSESGEEFSFNIDEIKDKSLRGKVEKLRLTERVEIPVKFKVSAHKEYGKFPAVNITGRSSQNVYAEPVTNDSLKKANFYYSNHQYKEAIKEYKKLLVTNQKEQAFAGIINCYIPICKVETEYIGELKEFVNSNINKVNKTEKVLKSLLSYYSRIEDINKYIECLEALIKIIDPESFPAIMQYTYTLACSYKDLHDYQTAIKKNLEWLSVYKKNEWEINNSKPETINLRSNVIYLELAELYYLIGNYAESEKYVDKCTSTESRKQILIDDLKIVKSVAAGKPDIADTSESDYLIESAETDNEDEIIETFDYVTTDEEVVTVVEESDTAEEETLSADPEEELLIAYEEYEDEYGFEYLNLKTQDILNKINEFTPDKLYCLLTYLKAAANLASAEPVPEQDYVDTQTRYAVQMLERAYSYAFNSPLASQGYDSMQIQQVFKETQKILPPEINGKFLTAAVIYALLYSPAHQVYYINDLIKDMESSTPEEFPELAELVNLLSDFYTSTGCGIDQFARYKSAKKLTDEILSKAKNLCDNLDRTSEMPEKLTQYREMRKLMFYDEEIGLKTYLKIAAENDTSKYNDVRNFVEDKFIRHKKEVSAENIYDDKIEDYINHFWEIALSYSKENTSKDYKTLKRDSNRYTEIAKLIKEVITCICSWLENVKNSEKTAFAPNFGFDDITPKVDEYIEGILSSCNSSENGSFDIGTESIRLALEELRAKIDGTYDDKSRKYFFIDFLSGEDILLNNDYLPELNSTFCNLPTYNILYRIEHHAKSEHSSLEKRLSEIFSSERSKHNFRSAMLIRKYGEDMGIKALSEHNGFAQYKEYLKFAARIFRGKFKDFESDLKLWGSYGKLSNSNGDVEKLLSLASAWNRITYLTTDYGFYFNLIENICNKISDDAVKKADWLTKQLEELSEQESVYDFGVFSKEFIAEQISNQNFISAEYILNCIRNHDTKKVNDYSAEPLGYFDEFIREHSRNYNAVADAGMDFDKKIFKYFKDNEGITTKDLDLALKRFTKNPHKDAKGGANLIYNWIPRGGPAKPEKLKELLKLLGFGTPERIEVDTSVSGAGDLDAYLVTFHKRIGKVNYVHPIPAFGSLSEREGFRVLCLYGNANCEKLMDKFRDVNAVSKNTLVLLDFALNMPERQKLAKAMKQEKSFGKTFIVVDRVILFFLALHYSANTVIKRLMSVTLPYSYYQPFIEASNINMPPELFTGREDDLTSIESPQGVNILYGGRQLGKSALLKMARRNIDKNGNGDRAVLIEVKDLNYTEAAKLVSEELIIEGILDESCKCDDWQELAKHLRRRLNDDNPETRINYLLLMLDEADEFIRTSAEANKENKITPITALKGIPADRFKLVMAGLHNLVRFGKEYLAHGNSNLMHLSAHTVRPFRRDEATKLLTYNLAYMGFHFSDEIITTILAKTNYYPGLIQFYCQKLLEAMKNDDYAGYHEKETPKYEVTESHFKKVLSNGDFVDKVNEKLEGTLFTEEKGRSDYHIIALIFAYLYYTSPNEKGHTFEELMGTAKYFEISRLVDEEKVEERLYEMVEMSVLRKSDDGYYNLINEDYRNLLGTKEKVEKCIMEKYMEEGVN